ncbi:MAG: M48 family metalloprotease [Candidatus Omnitrophica bacterium]|nr:M48 family metalloprotease [Candidatus Omnitrophota bacterium]
MPYSFTKIEQEKTKTLKVLFLLLVLFYYFSFWIICAFIFSYSKFNSTVHRATWIINFPGFMDSILILACSLVVGWVHWSFSARNLIPRFIKVLKAKPVDLEDPYHQKFNHIVEEVSIATGGLKIEPYVIPTRSLNAFALTDYKGRNVLGVTEGALAKLNRSQLEAIVGHEAAHLATRDSLVTSITSSLFEIYSGLLAGFSETTSSRRRRESSSESQAAGLVFVLLIAFLRLISYCLHMAISRQSDYRADAITVRLTRHPLAFAEALYIMSHHRLGTYMTASQLTAIFTLNPEVSYYEDKEGFWANLFTIHPPVMKRIEILLDMAHHDVKAMVQGLKNTRPITQINQEKKWEVQENQWMVARDQIWEGPFDLMTIKSLDWMTPETWVKTVGAGQVKMAYEDKRILPLFDEKNNALNELSRLESQCPHCHIALVAVNYEGAPVQHCSVCQGFLVNEESIQKIVLREGLGFSEDVVRMGNTILEENKQWLWKPFKRDLKTQIKCPNCVDQNRTMLQMYYTQVFRVLIDRCSGCDHIWFDQFELEVLQYLFDKTNYLE